MQYPNYNDDDDNDDNSSYDMYCTKKDKIKWELVKNSMTNSTCDLFKRVL